MSDIKLIHGDALIELEGKKSDIVIGDVPWYPNWNDSHYQRTFDLMVKSCNEKLFILVDNCLPAVETYLRYAGNLMDWRYHCIWMHDHTWTHILGFLHKGVEEYSQYYNIINFDNTRVTSFPEERPLEVMRYILNFDRERSVIDPFMGSGSSAVVAQEFGMDYTGIEINPNIFKLAESRLCVKS